MIRLCLPYTDNKETDAISGVLESGFLTQGDKVAEFERRIASFVGTKYAFATSSCTTALHMSLVAVGVGPGDEVIVPDFTFPATANVVVQLGAIPVLTDIQLDTFGLDIEDFKRKISQHTKAIMPVHAFGLAADMDDISQVAKDKGIYIIEDAACALGSTYKGMPCGSLGDAGCFSFHPRKTITTGEGGMITTDREDIASKISLLRNHGGKRMDGRFEFLAAGYNYRLSDIHGAIGLCQMDKLDWILERRKTLAAHYDMILGSVPFVRVPARPEYGGHTFQSYVILLDDQIDRDQVIVLCRNHGIETTIGTYALHAQQFFAENYGYKKGSIPHSFTAYSQSLTLPLYPQLRKSDIDAIISTLDRVLKQVSSE